MGLTCAALLLVSCGGDEELRDDDGVVTLAGQESVFELVPGDCLDPFGDPDATFEGEIPDVPVVPCMEPHTQEVYATYDIELDAYPGAAAVATIADSACIEQLDEQLELSLDDRVHGGSVFISYLLPTFDGWNRQPKDESDRTVVCVLVFQDRESAIGSVYRGDPEARIELAEPAPPSIDAGTDDTGTDDPDDTDPDDTDAADAEDV